MTAASTICPVQEVNLPEWLSALQRNKMVWFQNFGLTSNMDWESIRLSTRYSIVIIGPKSEFYAGTRPEFQITSSSLHLMPWNPHEEEKGSSKGRQGNQRRQKDLRPSVNGCSKGGQFLIPLFSRREGQRDLSRPLISSKEIIRNDINFIILI